MKLFTKSMLKIRVNTKLTKSSKTKKGFFPVTLKAPFLTLTQITLNFKCYRKKNKSKKKYNLHNTKASKKQSQS